MPVEGPNINHPPLQDVDAERRHNKLAEEALRKITDGLITIATNQAEIIFAGQHPEVKFPTDDYARCIEEAQTAEARVVQALQAAVYHLREQRLEWLRQTHGNNTNYD